MGNYTIPERHAEAVARYLNMDTEHMESNHRDLFQAVAKENRPSMRKVLFARIGAYSVLLSISDNRAGRVAAAVVLADTDDDLPLR